MIRLALLALLLLGCFSTGFGQEEKSQNKTSRRGENAVCGSRDATFLSMMGWGVGLGVGIATLCALIPSSAANSHTSSTSSGSTSH